MTSEYNWENLVTDEIEVAPCSIARLYAAIAHDYPANVADGQQGPRRV